MHNKNYAISQPAESFIDEDELSEAELDRVAGGFTPIPIPEGKLIDLNNNLKQITLPPSLLQNIVQQNRKP